MGCLRENLLCKLLHAKRTVGGFQGGLWQCVTCCEMFRGRTKGEERDGSRWRGDTIVRKQRWELHGPTACKQAAGQYYCLSPLPDHHCLSYLLIKLYSSRFSAWVCSLFFMHKIHKQTSSQRSRQVRQNVWEMDNVAGGGATRETRTAGLSLTSNSSKEVGLLTLSVVM